MTKPFAGTRHSGLFVAWFVAWLAILAAPPAPSSAQATETVTLTGVVTDAKTGETLPGANVFIATSMIGTTTDVDGKYVLQRVPLGALRLYVSVLGYEPGIRDIFLRSSTARQYDFALTQSVLELGQVTVEGERDRRWQRRFEKFVSQFIGETPNALESTITNQYVLDFNESRGVFSATASEPIVIENRALGYRVKYFLKDFESDRSRVRYDGEPLFEELEPSSPAEADRWEENRRKAFIGSFRHFLLALLADQVKEQGFVTFGRSVTDGPMSPLGASSTEFGSRFPVDPYSIISDGEDSSQHILNFEGAIEIIFQGELEDPSYREWRMAPGRSRERYQTSWIRLEKGPTIVDYKGDVLDPYGVTFFGYLAFERIADTVPREYRPGPSTTP